MGGGLVGRGWRVRDEAKGCRGMGGHSIDFVQDSRRRRRRRRGQPDPPLVVPTRLQHRPPPHIPPRLVSYSFSFEHRHSAPRPSRLLAFSLPFSLSPSLFSYYPFSTLSLFESTLSSHRSCSQRALDKMPRKPRVCGTPASSARFIDIYIQDQTNRPLYRGSCSNHAKLYS